eukprot:TRINITY_DN4649_c0_g1_i4.p1 TRINITY_DN4649_c0_g1~~TRINITY_DN4649_c0_g1_i4.p1  ORF type:complete len:1729 (-),score=497.82 TRINITY_DN4649_c0_g1_i4:53-5104(-)
MMKIIHEEKLFRKTAAHNAALAREREHLRLAGKGEGARALAPQADDDSVPHLLKAQTTTQVLWEKILEIRKKGDSYDVFFNANMKELQREDRCKKQLELALTTLTHFRDFQKLVNELTGSAIKISVELIPKIDEASGHMQFFDTQRNHKRVRPLIEAWYAVLTRLKSQLWDVVRGFRKRSDNNQLAVACAIVDRLTIKEEVIEFLCSQYVDAFVSTFSQQWPITESAARFDWIFLHLPKAEKDTIKVCDFAPDSWNIRQTVSRSLSFVIRDQIVASIRDTSSVDSTALLSTVQKTREFQDQELGGENVIYDSLTPFFSTFVSSVSRSLADILETKASELKADISKSKYVLRALSQEIERSLNQCANFDRDVQLKNVELVCYKHIYEFVALLFDLQNSARKQLQERLRREDNTLQQQVQTRVHQHSQTGSAKSKESKADAKKAEKTEDLKTSKEITFLVFLTACNAARDALSVVESIEKFSQENMKNKSQTPASQSVRRMIQDTVVGCWTNVASTLCDHTLPFLTLIAGDWVLKKETQPHFQALRTFLSQNMPEIKQLSNELCKSIILDTARQMILKFEEKMLASKPLQEESLVKVLLDLSEFSKILIELPRMTSQSINLPNFPTDVEVELGRIRKILETSLCKKEDFVATFLTQFPAADMHLFQVLLDFRGADKPTQKSLMADVSAQLRARPKKGLTSSSGGSQHLTSSAGAAAPTPLQLAIHALNEAAAHVFAVPVYEIAAGAGTAALALSASAPSGPIPAAKPTLFASVSNYAVSWKLEERAWVVSAYELILTRTALAPTPVENQESLLTSLRLLLGISNRAHNALMDILKNDFLVHGAYLTFRASMLGNRPSGSFAEEIFPFKPWRDRQLAMLFEGLFRYLVRLAEPQTGEGQSLRPPVLTVAGAEVSLLEAVEEISLLHTKLSTWPTQPQEQWNKFAEALTRVDAFIEAIAAASGITQSAVVWSQKIIFMPYPYPVNVQLYQSVVESLFGQDDDDDDDSSDKEETRDALLSSRVLSSLHNVLRITPLMHHLCVVKCAQSKYLHTYNGKLILVMREHLTYISRLRRTERSPQSIAERRKADEELYRDMIFESFLSFFTDVLEDYRTSFSVESTDLIEALAVFIQTKQIIYSVTHSQQDAATRERQIEQDVDHLIQSSLRRHYKKIFATVQSETQKQQLDGAGFAQLSKLAAESLKQEIENFSPLLRKGHREPEKTACLEIARRLHQDVDAYLLSLRGELDRSAVEVIENIETVKEIMAGAGCVCPSDVLSQTEPVMMEWAAQQSTAFDHILQNSLSIEQWSAVSGEHRISASAIDINSLFSQTIGVLGSLKHVPAMSVKMILGKIMEIVADYSGAVLSSCRAKVNKSDAKNTKITQLLLKMGRKMIDEEEAEKSEQEDFIQVQSVDTMCVRLNNVLFTRAKIQSLWSQVESLLSAPEKQPIVRDLRSLFVSTDRSLESCIRDTQSLIGERVIKYAINLEGKYFSLFHEIYYPVPTEAPLAARLEHHLQNSLVEIKEGVTDSIFETTLNAVLQLLVFELTEVLLGKKDDKYRRWSVEHERFLHQDLDALSIFFAAEISPGEYGGLHPDTIEKQLESIRLIIPNVCAGKYNPPPPQTQDLKRVGLTKIVQAPTAVATAAAASGEAAGKAAQSGYNFLKGAGAKLMSKRPDKSAPAGPAAEPQ